MCALTWVLPLYRTRAFLDELLTRIEATRARMGVASEVILVDDACPEGSAAALAARSLPVGVRVLALPERRGQEGALRAGLAASRGDWVVTLDADLQDPPEAVAELWASRDGHEAVFADRRGRYESAGRLLTSRLYRTLASRLGGLPRGAGLFVLLVRPLIDRLLADDHRPLLAAIAAHGRRFGAVTIERATRPAGESAYRGRDRLARGVRSLAWLACGRLRRPTGSER